MKIIKVTKLQKQVLEALADLMYAEWGFSDVTFERIQEETDLNPDTLKGVLVSLSNQKLIFTNEEYKDVEENIIFYLEHETQGLVPEWIEESNQILNEKMRLKPIKLEVK